MINLTWTSGDGANNTYIERNTTESWLRGQGTEIYNGSGTNYEDTGLSAGVTYYYQAWSYTNWTYNPTLQQWSDDNASASNTTDPINTSVDPISPYNVTSSPLTINATNYTSVDNVTLWYRYSSDNSTWWNADWRNKNETVISNNITDYSVNYNFSYTDFFNSNCQADFDDARFIGDNSTELYYWIEEKSDSNYLNVWINISNTSFLSVYYGNSTASQSSYMNGSNTFYYGFDDFENAFELNWSEESTGSGSVSFDNSIKKFGSYSMDIDAPSGSNQGRCYLNEGWGTDEIKVMYWVRYHLTGVGNEVCYLYMYDEDLDQRIYCSPYTLNDDVRVKDGGTTYNLAPYAEDTWFKYTWELDNDNAQFDFYIDDVLTADDYAYVAGATADESLGHFRWTTGAGTQGGELWTDAFCVMKWTSGAEPSLSSFGSEENGWMQWDNTSNPDTDYASGGWNWTFDFPNSTGYYEFYSIGKKSGSTDETAPSSADAICYYNPDVTKPNISFVPPTPPDNNQTTNTYAYINVSVTDASDTSSFIDWDNSLVGYWNFDHTNSTHVFDNSSYQHNGSFNGTTLGQSNLTTGKYGVALDFSNTDEYVLVNRTTDLEPEDFAIELWAKVDGRTGSIQVMVDKTYNNDQSVPYSSFEVAYDRSNNDKIEVFLGWNTVGGWGTAFDTHLSSAGILPIGTWTHIAWVFNDTNDNIKLYVNGELDVNESETHTLIYDTSSTGHLYLGAGPGNAYQLNGSLDEVRIWNRALSWEEINASYNSSDYKLYHNFTGLGVYNYSYYAHAIDAAGNENTTETRHFEVLAENTSINVTPSTWSIGNINLGENTSTVGSHFTVLNEGNVPIDIQIKADNATNSTFTWNLTSTPAHNNFTLQYNKSSEWIQINTSYDTFHGSLGVDASQTFDLRIFMATTSDELNPMSFDITFKSVAS